MPRTPDEDRKRTRDSMRNETYFLEYIQNSLASLLNDNNQQLKLMWDIKLKEKGKVVGQVDVMIRDNEKEIFYLFEVKSAFDQGNVKKRTSRRGYYQLINAEKQIKKRNPDYTIYKKKVHVIADAQRSERNITLPLLTTSSLLDPNDGTYITNPTFLKNGSQ